MSNQERHEAYILELINKFKNGDATEADIKALDDWYDQPVSTAGYTDGMSVSEKAKVQQRIYENINLQIAAETSSRRRIIPYTFLKAISIAATLLITIGAGMFYWISYKNEKVKSPLSSSVTKPGNSKALLTLGNGKQIILSDTKNGIVARQASTTIRKSGSNEIVYNSPRYPDSKVEYNTMSTLRGGEYHLVLADGTNVWLNAASSIKYPTAFPGGQRIVEVSGEAYFEVAHNASKPFKVIARGQVIEVLGTHFNVNAYSNEPQIKTTLLQGSVKVFANGAKKLLKPGQQSSVSADNFDLYEVDTKEAISWKEGYFDFTDASIESVMRQISRWYDVDVVFEGKLSEETFTGRVSKYLDIRQFLALVRSPRIHINYNGRRIMIKE